MNIFLHIYNKRDRMTSIETTPEIKGRYAQYYHEVVKPNEQRLQEERERIRTYCKEKFLTLLMRYINNTNENKH